MVDAVVEEGGFIWRDRDRARPGGDDWVGVTSWDGKTWEFWWAGG